MKPDSSKLKQQQQQATVATRSTQSAATAHEFNSPEEMIRADAAQTQVPESVKTRLADSVAREPAPKRPRPWWRRFLP